MPSQRFTPEQIIENPREEARRHRAGCGGKLAEDAVWRELFSGHDPDNRELPEN